MKWSFKKNKNKKPNYLKKNSSHFKLEFLGLLKVEMYYKLLDKVRIQIIPNDLGPPKLQNKIIFPVNMQAYINQPAYIMNQEYVPAHTFSLSTFFFKRQNQSLLSFITIIKKMSTTITNKK